MKTKHKFKRGDRVIYNAVECGNGCLEGKIGTVIYVDNTRCPYTVEFDDFSDYYLACTDYRARKYGHEPKPFAGWFCREENLTLIQD